MTSTSFPVPSQLVAPEPRELRHELRRVLTCELARRLREAAELVIEPRSTATWEESRSWSGWTRPWLPSSLAAWREEVEELFAVLEEETGWARGVRRPGAPRPVDPPEFESLSELRLLAACADRPEAEWPEPQRLAEAALTLCDGEEARLTLARVHLAEGRPRLALRVLAAAQRRGVSPENEWRLFTGLGRTHEVAGADRLALEAFSRASEAPDCGPTPKLDGLFHAMALGATTRSEALAAALRTTAPPRRRLERELEAQRRRLLARGVVLPWRPSHRGTDLRFRRWCREGTEPAAVLCRALASTSFAPTRSGSAAGARA